MIGWRARLPTRVRKLGIAIYDGPITRGRRVWTFERGALKETMCASLCTKCSSARSIWLSTRHSRTMMGRIAVVWCSFLCICRNIYDCCLRRHMQQWHRQ